VCVCVGTLIVMLLFGIVMSHNDVSVQKPLIELKRHSLNSFSKELAEDPRPQASRFEVCSLKLN